MTKPTAQSRPIDRCILVIGAVWSFVIVFAFYGLYYRGDVGQYWRWHEFIGSSWQDLYINCEWCTYPVLGVLASAGTMDLLDSLPFDGDRTTYEPAFRWVLAGFGAANVLLVYLILRVLDAARSGLWAGLVGLLPSSWVGSALWGQIDGVTQFYLFVFLLCAICLCHTAHRGRGAGKRSLTMSLFAVVAGLAAAGSILTKQLAMFSFPVLVFVFAAGCFVYARERWLAVLATFLVTIIVAIALPDLILRTPHSEIFHFEHMLGLHSPHINRIAANGFNIWILLGFEMDASSRKELLPMVSPKLIGLTLFMIVEFFLFVATLRWLYRAVWERRNPPPLVEFFATMAFLLALTNLTFNVFLTGMHERYLFHFYPFIVIAYLGLRTAGRPVSPFMQVLVLFGAVAYAAFVLGILGGEEYAVWPFREHMFQAAFHLILFCYLTVLYWRQVASTEPLAGQVRPAH